VKVTLTDTTTSKIAAGLAECRAKVGSSGGAGMVLTIIIVTDVEHQLRALHEANQAAQQHPARVIVVSYLGARGTSRLDAVVEVGGSDSAGESVLLQFTGEVSRYPQTVVMPLLLPESPVVIWWPDSPPADMLADPLGGLADRRIADTYMSKRPVTALRKVSENYSPGDTDMAWTRLTPWRTLLAAALDQHPGRVKGAIVESEPANASARLLSAWLTQRLRVPVTEKQTDGPGITAARLVMPEGEISIFRPDGMLAEYSVPGQPIRHVALKRRTVADLLQEELLRLDPDDVYAAVVKEYLRHADSVAAPKRAGRKTKKAAATIGALTSSAASRAPTSSHTDGTAAKKSPGRTRGPSEADLSGVNGTSVRKSPARKTTTKKAAASPRKSVGRKAAAKKGAARKTAGSPNARKRST
jgi:glucose-6-phosphate dehydrogenase assembly protein OpcA